MIKLNNILFRYIATNFLKNFIVVFLCFFFIMAVLESMEVVRRYFSNSIDVSYITIFKLTFYHTIVGITSFFAFVVFLSAILFFVSMHHKLELTVMQVIGVSVIDLLKSLFFTTLIFGAFYITVLDGLSAFSVLKIKDTDIHLKEKTRGVDKSMTVTNAGIWFRDVCDSKPYIIYAKLFDKKMATFFNVRLFEFSETNEFKRSVYSRSAVITNGEWQLNDAAIITSDGEDVKVDSVKIKTKLSPGSINRLCASPNSISFWRMKRYTTMLEKVGLSSVKYKIHSTFRFAAILQMFAFVVLVTAFCVNYNSRNTRKYSLKIAILLATAFPIYFINNLLMAFGEKGDIPILLSALIIPVFTMLIGISCLARK